MKQIITIQHTQSIHHTNGMVGSWTDWDLTPQGIEQAQRIAIRLREQLPGEDWEIYTSDLLRARRTAGIIGQAFGVTPVHNVALRERNLGACVGQSVEWLKQHMTAPERTIDDRLFPDGESRRDAWNRFLPFFRQLTDSDVQRVIIVSHGDLLGLFHAMWLGLPPEFFNTADFSGMAGGVSFLQERDDGKRIIRRLCDTSFIL